jgi:hypothetical protein
MNLRNFMLLLTLVPTTASLALAEEAADGVDLAVTRVRLVLVADEGDARGHGRGAHRRPNVVTGAEPTDALT